MTGTFIHWTRGPQVLIDGLKDYQEKLLVAVYAIAEYWGQQVQDDARKKAHWEDRTGNARSGLFFAVDSNGFGISGTLGTVGLGKSGKVLKQTGAAAKKSTNRRAVSVGSRDEKDFQVISAKDNTIAIYLSHTMYYGKFLELSNGGKYAIIVSTMNANLPALGNMLLRMFKG